VIRRVIDDDTLMAALTLAAEVDNDDLREIVPALEEFTQAVANYLSADPADAGTAMKSLADKQRRPRSWPSTCGRIAGSI